MGVTRPVWRWPARWLVIRDRLLSDARFQRWAVRFPATRWIARRRARQLFDLCAGFVYSQVLFACVELRLFDILAGGPLPEALLAQRLSLTPAAARRLLEAARALGLVESRGPGTYGLGGLGAALRGNPGVAAMIGHHAMLYADLADPVALLRGGPTSRRLASFWPYALDRADAPPLTGAAVSPYTQLMAASQAMVAAEILDVYPVERHRSLLDVGGGDGSFLRLAGARAPSLALTLFDLPAVAEQARVRFGEAGLGDRARIAGGDFRRDPLPRGADLVSLVRVIHDHDEATALALLRAVRLALPDDGTLLLAEPMADTPGAEPVGHAYFGFYLLAMGSGRPRSVAELSGLLRQAGFTQVRPIRTRTPMITGLLVAQP